MRYLALVRVSLFVVISVLVNACASMDAPDSKAFRIADANLKLGIGYYRQDRLEDALKVLRKALNAQGDYGEVHSVIAVVYEKLYMLDDAEDHYQTAMDLQPEEGGVYNNYGGYLCRRKKYSDAEYYFKKALTFPRYKTPEQVYENAGLCSARVPDLEKAEQYFRKALAIDSMLPQSLLGMANIMFEKKRFMSVRAYLQRYEAVSRHSSQSLLLGIKVERKLGDPVAETRYARLLRANHPNSAEFTQWLNETSQGEIKP